jgi:hypothetical protein
MKNWCKLLVCAAIAVGSAALPGSPASAADTDLRSPYDTNNTFTHPDYDIDYVGYFYTDSNPSVTTFYLVFAKPIFRTQFADGRGWASISFDTNGDDLDDISLGTDDYVLPAEYESVPGYAYDVRRAKTLSCPVSVQSTYSWGGKILMFTVSTTCLGLSGRIGVQGYAKYLAAPTGSGFDFAPDDPWVLTEANPTPPTTITPPTTAPPAAVVVPPASPSGLTTTSLGAGSVRLDWVDSSANEEGFLLQRNDTPVPAGTTVANWPYKIPANTTSYTVSGLSGAVQVCFAVASYNAAGASAFTNYSCVSTGSQTPTTPPTTSPPAVSLGCSAEWPRSKASRAVRASVDPANAGKRLKFEIFNRGKFELLGAGRVRADGTVMFTASSTVAKLRGPYKIRATQGSRFICEGTIR